MQLGCCFLWNFGLRAFRCLSLTGRETLSLKPLSNVTVYLEFCFEGRNLEAVNIVQKTWNIIED